jgi:hypothetical protein
MRAGASRWRPSTAASAHSAAYHGRHVPARDTGTSSGVVDVAGESPHGRGRVVAVQGEQAVEHRGQPR